MTAFVVKRSHQKSSAFAVGLLPIVSAVLSAILGGAFAALTAVLAAAATARTGLDFAFNIVHHALCFGIARNHCSGNRADGDTYK